MSLTTRPWNDHMLKYPSLTALVILILMGPTSNLMGSTSNFSQTDVLFDSGSPDYEGFSPSDFSYSGSFGFPQTAAPFTLTSDSFLQQIDWWGVFWSPTTDGTVPLSDSFRVQIFPVENGLPTTTPIAQFQPQTVTRTNSGLNFGGNDVFSYSFDVTGLNLTTGEYALEIVNDSTSDLNDDWHWLTSCDLCGHAFVRAGDNSSWQLASNTLSLQVHGVVVPEPASILLACALIVLVGVHYPRATQRDLTNR